MKSYHFPIVGAFLIFEREKSRNIALRAMNKYNLCSFGRSYPSEFLYNGNIKLNVKAAPEPNTIYWENYGISKGIIFLRLFLLFIVLTALVVITFVISYVVKE